MPLLDILHPGDDLEPGKTYRLPEVAVLELQPRPQELEEKLRDTQDTDKDFYLIHAGQSGYLVRNTTIRFFAQIKGQFGTSTETKIRGITLPELQMFIDSTGRETLSAISTRANPDLVETESGEEKVVGVEAVHVAFAQAIVDFLDMEQHVDIDGIKRQYREDRADSAFRPIGHWGADRETVLEKLIERRGDLDRKEIKREFNLGYESPGSKI